MSRITKEIAHTTAIRLLYAKHLKIKELKEQLKIMVTDAVKSTIPHEVMEMYEKHPNFFKTHYNTRFFCAGFGYEYYNFNPLPDEGYDPKIGTQIGNKILALTAKIEVAEKKYKELRNEIEVALFAFRTYANVEKEFPEAFALLPTKVSQTVMININSLRSQLNYK